MSYIPQKKAQFMYNSFSGRKNRIFEEKKIFFEIFNFVCLPGGAQRTALDRRVLSLLLGSVFHWRSAAAER